MSVFQPFRCLIAKLATPSSGLRRSFHASKLLHDRPKPKYPSIKASKLGIKNGKVEFPPYSAAERAALAKQYTPAQIAAIEAGEAAVDPDDLAGQATIREDTMVLPYLDDLSKIHPVVDKPIRAPESNYDPNLRLKKPGELLDDFANWMSNQPGQPEKEDFLKFTDGLRLTVGMEEAERNPRSSLAPELPVIDSLKPRQLTQQEREEGEIDPATRRTMLQTGLSAHEIKRFRVKTLVQHKVVNQTRLGKAFKNYILVATGNQSGVLGIGEAKASNQMRARKQATLNAIRNMRPVARYENRTIFGDLHAKVGGTELLLMTRPPGKYFPTDLVILSCWLTDPIQALASDVITSFTKSACA